MKPIKSERLRKLELELKDLEQWLHLGLVPKKDVERHKEEIRVLQEKITEEKDRLQFLKEGGDGEEFVIPKRGAAKAGYNEVPTVPDIDIADSNAGLSDAGFEMETYITEDSSTIGDSEGNTLHSHEGNLRTEDINEAAFDDFDEEEEEESYFSDKNRWKRGGIVDPDADDW